MKAPIDKVTAESRVIRKYHKLYVPLVELVAALQNLEPGGTMVDEAEFTKKKDGQIRVTYKARPVQLTITDGHRRLTVRMDELS